MYQNEIEDQTTSECEITFKFKESISKFNYL